MLSRAVGPFLIALAAALWATDALFRLPTVQAMDPTYIVFVEHLLSTAVLLPWVWFRRQGRQRLRGRDLLGFGVIGTGGSALATVLFTASFRYVNPSVSILLQKLQPVIVTLLASVFLAERPGRGFFGWALVALLSSIVLSFPDFNFQPLLQGLDLRSRGALYAVLAATLWASSTVVGKALLSHLAPSVVTFGRLAAGLVTLTLLLLLGSAPLPIAASVQPPLRDALLYMALVPGLIAMLAYYAGLARTRASSAAFVELVFPVSAVLLNTFFLNAPLSFIQLAAGAALLFSVLRISAANPAPVRRP